MDKGKLITEIIHWTLLITLIVLTAYAYIDGRFIHNVVTILPCDETITQNILNLTPTLT